MTVLPDSGAPVSLQTEARDARHRLRQDEIIIAARRCFRQHGFHAASMAQLATEAQLSVGQIYRYFTNKDAIIQEIVKRIIDSRVQEMLATSSNIHLARMLAWREAQDEDDEALMVEVAAEATRNPRVAQMIADADERMFSHACQKVARLHPEFSAERVRASVEILAVMVEGTSYRRLTPQKASPERLYTLYQHINDLLFKSEES
ncbi:TetR/AcrR family transcriptional regulator [Erwinia rhapontici]|uniref:TetR/AcrR family transcriptional regulator n=1 Tax=Erwinia rhapontici TaxID=55212 RepID=UPI003BA1B049